MKPTVSDVHINRPLTNVSTAYIQDQKDFVATRVFPIVPVNKKSDLFFRYDKGDFMRDEMELRAEGTKSAGGGYSLDTDSYACKNYGYHTPVTDDLRENADQPLSPDADASEFVAQKGLIKLDKLFFANYFKTGVWASDPVPAIKWDAANSTPIKDVKGYITAIKKLTGFRPQKLVFSPDVVDVLSEHDDFVERIKYTSSDSVDLDMMAKLFGVEEVLRAESVNNTAKEGQTAVMAYNVPAESGLLVFAQPAPALKKPSGGYIFAWKRRGLAGSFGNTIKKWREESVESDIIEINMSVDPKLVAADCGAFINDILT